MKDVLKPVLMFAVAVAVGFYTGFVMQYLWNWFAAPAFHLDPISYWRMCGLVTLFNLINPSGIDSEKRRHGPGCLRCFTYVFQNHSTTPLTN